MIWWISGLSRRKGNSDESTADTAVAHRRGEAEQCWGVFSGVTFGGDSSIECVSRFCAVAIFILHITFCSVSWAGDWPQLGFDGQHSSNSAEELPRGMGVRWGMKLPKLEPAWPDQNRLRNDSVYQPIIVEGKLIVPSPLDDSVTAYDLRDGGEVWRFYCGGPI